MIFMRLFGVAALFFWFALGISFEAIGDFQKDEITYVWEDEPNWLEAKRVFLDAFVKCYSRIPLDVLRQPSREKMVEWLGEAFEGIRADYKSSRTYVWLSAKLNDGVVGFLLIDTADYPNEIYLAQLAVQPMNQGKGIASAMIGNLFDRYSKCDRFVLVTRRANEEAKGLYHALGFIPSSYMREGYSRELYAGFESINQSFSEKFR